MFTIEFWKAVAERAIKSAAQGALTVWALVEVASKQDVINAAAAAGWGALSMGVLSVLTSIASGYVSQGTPSLTNAEVLAPEPTGTHEQPAA